MRKHRNTVARFPTISQLQISKVGFPIRKFTDQSLFAAPHDLSQRTTSFIASQRQGIHRIPLRHLIALITNAHRSAATTRSTANACASSAVQELVKALIGIIKTSFASNTSGSFAVKRSPRLRCSRGHEAGSPTILRPNVFSLYDVRYDARRRSAHAKLFSKGRCATGDCQRLVEPDGIEPTTSCLQSTRSPN